MVLQLHHVLEVFSTLFALEGFVIGVSPEVLVVIPFVRITVITLTAFIHYTTVGVLTFNSLSCDLPYVFNHIPHIYYSTT